MIGGGGFEADPIGVDLDWQLLLKETPPLALPPAGPLAPAEKQTNEHQAGEVGGQMIAVDVGPFQVAGNKVPVNIQKTKVSQPEFPVRPRRRSMKDVKKPGQGHGAKGHVHGAGPVDPHAHRVPLHPVFDDPANRLGVSFLAGQPIRLAGGKQPLQAGQFPRHLYVAFPFRVSVADAAEGNNRPGMTGLEIPVPVNGAAQVNGPRTQQVHAMFQRLVRRRQDTGPVRGANPVIPFRVHGLGKGRERQPGQALPLRIDAVRAEDSEQTPLRQPPRPAGRKEHIHFGGNLAKYPSRDHPGRLAPSTAYEFQPVFRHCRCLPLPAGRIP